MAKSAANPAAIRGRDREFKILFISGYANAFEASLQENTQFVFLPKPFTLGQLITAERDRTPEEERISAGGTRRRRRAAQPA